MNKIFLLFCLIFSGCTSGEIINILDSGVKCNASDDGACPNSMFGFTFKRWDKEFLGARQSTNGCITLTQANGQNSGICTYSGSPPLLDYSLYPFWTDLINNCSTPRMAFKAFDDYVVFGWYGVSRYNSACGAYSNSFEIIIRENGSYNFNYGDLNIPNNDDFYVFEQGSQALNELEVFFSKITEDNFFSYLESNNFDFIINVPSDNDVPTLVGGDLIANLSPGQVFSGQLIASDMNGLSDGSYFVISTPPSDGQVSISERTGRWIYLASSELISGFDNFSVSITDDLGNIFIQEITIVIGDSDKDDVPDVYDNCPSEVNSDQLDFDQDLIGDLCDNDNDNDGLINESDAFPFDANEQYDSDDDGIGDNIDNCISITNPDQSDFDDDLRGDVCDSDADGDGVQNEFDSFPLDPYEQYDSDDDGIGDNLDNCPSVGNFTQLDFDGDEVGDLCDDDIDNDGIANLTENKFSGNNFDPSDIDFVIDNYQAYIISVPSDKDNDGVSDEVELSLSGDEISATYEKLIRLLKDTFIVKNVPMMGTLGIFLFGLLALLIGLYGMRARQL